MKYEGNHYFKLNLDKICGTEENPQKSQSKDEEDFISRRKQKSRQNNSLEELTRKFVKYSIETKSNRINLNSIMKKMKISKRRIYDITNVMEGK
jgi:hypothetical protein